MSVITRCRHAARRGTVALVAAGALGLAAPAGAADWVKLRPLKTPRFGVAATTARNGLVYAIGGASNQRVLPTVSIYDAAANTWRPGPRLPQGDCARHPEQCGVLDAIAATGSDGRIYVFDGNPEWPRALALDPAGGDWQPVPAMPTPRPGVAGTAGADGRIYALGGMGDQVLGLASRVNEVFDPATQRWSERAPMPRARVRHTVAAGADGRIYVFGGLVGDQVLRSVDIYDPATDSWTSGAPMPTPRYSAGAALGRDGRIYVFGGGTDAASGDGAARTTDVFDPATNSWSGGPPLRVWRQQIGVAVAPRGRILAIGGRDNRERTAVEGLRLGR